jgi:hypothetical protein
MALGPHTAPMLSIASALSNNAMRTAVIGARANDPVVPDHLSDRTSLELGRFSEGMEVHPLSSSLWRVGRFSDGMSRAA